MLSKFGMCSLAVKLDRKLSMKKQLSTICHSINTYRADYFEMRLLSPLNEIVDRIGFIS